jgi:hypothetical protein
VSGADNQEAKDWNDLCIATEKAHPALHEFLETWGPHCGAPRAVFRGHLVKLIQSIMGSRGQPSRDSVIEECANWLEKAPLTYAGPDPQGVKNLRFLIVLGLRGLKRTDATKSEEKK